MYSLYKSDCIPCKESDLPYQQIDEDAEDDDSVTEMCENLYVDSAKCNRHIGGADEESYITSEQEDNEGAICSYIQSVVTGHYDEDGYNYVDADEYAKSNWANQYAIDFNEQYREVSLFQIFSI